MNSDPMITILMATYNGEHYIKEQLDSLINQTYTNWHLLIRDDGSTDKTIHIINNYISRHKNIKIIINKNSNRGGGACSNFSALFKLALKDQTISYIMFCDQDDIWKPRKIEESFLAMRALEAAVNNGPALVYSDFELMDTQGRFISGTFRLKHKINLNNLLSYNYVYGCTIMLNRQLINKIADIPAEAINHDYWIALVASIYYSVFINQKLICYRQHTYNASGNIAGNNSMSARLKRYLLKPHQENKNFLLRMRMFQVFAKRHSEDLTQKQKRMLDSYLNAFEKGRIRLVYVMVGNRIFRNGFFQTFASFFQILFFYKHIKNGQFE